MAGIPLTEIEISTRARNALGAMGYKTTDDLIRAGEDELMRTPNFGRRSLDDIKLALEELGLSFGDELPPPEAPDLERMFAILEEKVVRHLAEGSQELNRRVDDVVAALNATQRANGLDQMMELLLSLRKAIDLRLDDLMLAVRLARKPSANGVDTGME